MDFKTYNPITELIAGGGGSGLYLPISGGLMQGAIVQPLAPTNPFDVANKTYVDNAVLLNGTPDATTTVKGKVKLAGDLSGTADLPVVAPLAITNAKLANMSAIKQIKGSNGLSSATIDLSLGAGLDVGGSSLVVDSTTLPTVPVANGGTGTTSLTGYLKGNGTSPISGVSTIPVADVQGAVGSVNGIFPSPTNGGNVSILVGQVSTGPLGGLPPQPQLNGNIYVVSADPTPVNNGRTFISTGSVWEEVTANQAATDARYVLKAGDTMTGALNMPTGTKVTLADLPTAGTDAANKQYVDNQIVLNATPDATPLIKGKIQLAGDFDPTSTAAIPIIGANKITYPKIQQVSAVSLLGNPTGALANVQEIALGNSLLFDSGLLKSPFSFYGGTDPNITSPTDRPGSTNTLYMGTDGQLWVWVNPIYVALTPVKLLVRAKDFNVITLNLGDYVDFGSVYVFRDSNQGLTITQPSGNKIFQLTLAPNRAPVIVKLTVSIGGLYSNNWGHFFTWNLTTSSYTLDCPGLFITPNNRLSSTNRTHVYTEFIKVNPGTVQIAVKLKEIYGGTGPVTIGLTNNPLVPDPYRYIMFEEV